MQPRLRPCRQWCCCRCWRAGGCRSRSIVFVCFLGGVGEMGSSRFAVAHPGQSRGGKKTHTCITRTVKRSKTNSRSSTPFGGFRPNSAVARRERSRSSCRCWCFVFCGDVCVCACSRWAVVSATGCGYSHSTPSPPTHPQMKHTPKSHPPAAAPNTPGPAPAGGARPSRRPTARTTAPATLPAPAVVPAAGLLGPSARGL